MTWKEKILDYEIETLHRTTRRQRWHGLEKKRFSITRLKLGCLLTNEFTSCFDLKRKDSRLRDWNSNWSIGSKPSSPKSWKEKILDYEIETGIKTGFLSYQRRRLEKKRFSITRLKHMPLVFDSSGGRLGLKRKDSRLRDWNWLCFDR